MKTEPETITISFQIALEEEVERLTSAERASKNRILALAQGNANLKVRVAEMEAELATLKPAIKTDKPKAN